MVEVWPNVWVAQQQLLHHVQTIRTWWCGRFLLVSCWPTVRKVEECKAQEVFPYLRLSGRNHAIASQISSHWRGLGIICLSRPAVMSGFVSTISLTDLPEQWKERPPKSSWGKEVLNVCVLKSHLSVRTKQTVISAREACIQFRTKKTQMDEREGIGETHSRWFASLFIQIQHHASGHNCPCFVKHVIQTTAEGDGDDDEIVQSERKKKKVSHPQ